MPYNVPDNYAHQQQADAQRIKEAQEFQRQQQEAADAAREAAKIAEEQRRAREMAAADQAARMGGTHQRY